ncbi:MAG: 4Fe-4S dicluster domain-containing protein [Bacillota bacterium]
MSATVEQVRKTARELLEKGEVKYVIGWEKGTFGYQSPPVFISRPEDVDKLVWDQFCVNNLAKYLLDDKNLEGKIALFVKGCDSRGINRLLQDNQIDREKVIVIGLPCPGMKDAALAAEQGHDQDLPLLAKCQECTHPNPVVADVVLGDAVPVSGHPGRLEEVSEIEQKSPDEKYDYWASQYDRCIRCYACRNVCPACNCRECIFDQTASGWLSKASGRSENQFYGITRAMHVAGRCIECGECERVCPMGIPLMQINRKLIKDINELFGEYEAGLDKHDRPPLGRYNTEDPEEFM